MQPENILLCKDGHIKLIDFGSAKYLDVESYHDENTGGRDVLIPKLLIIFGGMYISSSPPVVHRLAEELFICGYGGIYIPGGPGVNAD